MNVTAYVQQIKDFLKHWAKEIVVALILAILAAVVLDWYSEKSTDQILDANSKAIAVITTYDKKGERLGQGSGFFMSKDGVLATNYHVIRGADISTITAQLPATRAIYLAKNIIGGDEKKDIALLQFDAKDTPYVRLGDSSKIKAGQKVIAIGAPLGLGNTVSEGIISNPERQMGSMKFIQFTAPISPGSSGGGLFDKRGTVIGVTAGSIPGTQQEPGQNLNFAVPINLVRDSLAGKDASLTTDSATYFYSLGQLEENKHNFDQALAYYMKAVSLDSNFADAYLGIGGIYYEKGDYKSEVMYYEKAVALAPNDYEAISTLGSAYEDEGRYDDAIKMYKKAIELKPDDKDSMFTLALLSILTGDIETARQLLPSLMRLNAGTGKEIEALIGIASK